MGDGLIFQKIYAPLSLINAYMYKMNLISAGSISLDSTFNLLNNFERIQYCAVFLRNKATKYIESEIDVKNIL
jgi:hypothetical protein